MRELGHPSTTGRRRWTEHKRTHRPIGSEVPAKLLAPSLEVTECRPDVRHRMPGVNDCSLLPKRAHQDRLDARRRAIRTRPNDLRRGCPTAIPCNARNKPVASQLDLAAPRPGRLVECADDLDAKDRRNRGPRIQADRTTPTQ